MDTIIFIAILAISAINLAVSIWHFKTAMPRIYISGKPIEKSDLKKLAEDGVIRVQQNPRKGSVYFPPSDIEVERQRVIDTRKAQGLDTPVEFLRERTNEE
jgi:hypothetical protein